MKRGPGAAPKEPSPGLRSRLHVRVRALARETLALLLAARHPRTPWPARLVVALVVAYAVSPIDLIPDFLPVIGALDDLVLIPLGLALALRLVPAEVLRECRDRARALDELPDVEGAAAVVLGTWALVAILLGVWIHGLLTAPPTGS